MAIPYVPGADPEEDRLRAQAAGSGFDMKLAMASAVPMDTSMNAPIPVSPLPIGQMRANLDRAQGLPATQTVAAPRVVAEAPPPMPGAVGVPQYAITDPVNKISSTATTSTSKSIGTKAEKEAVADRVKAIGAEAEAGKAVAKAEAEKFNIEAEAEDKKTVLIAERRAQQLAADEAASKEVAAKESDFENRKNDYAKAKPSEYMEGGGGNKLLAAISIAMGQYASGMGAGPNNALAIVNKQIDDHRTKEADRIARMKDDVVMARTGINDAKEARSALWRDNDAKMAAAAEDTLQKYTARKLRAGADAEVLKGDKFAAGIQGKIGEIKEEAAMRDRTQVNSSKTSVSVTQDRDSVPGSGAKNSQVATPGTVFGAGGVAIANVGDDKKAQAINLGNANYRVMNGYIDQLQKHYDKNGMVLPFSKEAQERESLSSQILTIGKEQEKLGALSGPDMQLMESVFGSKFEQLSGRGANKIGSAKSRVDQKQGVFLESYGLPSKEFLGKVQGSGLPDAGPAAEPQQAPRVASASAPRMDAKQIAGAQEFIRNNPGPKAEQVKAALRAALGGQ